MKVIIAEDEPLAAERLERMLATTDRSIEVAGIAASGSECIKLLQQYPSIELILMDIELSDGNCFDIFHQVQINCPVIFVTSFDQYVLKAFETNSIDYLLKPVRLEDLAGSLAKYKRIKDHFTGTIVHRQLADIRCGLSSVNPQPHIIKNNFLVRTGTRYIPVQTTDISCFFVDGRLNYVETREYRKYPIDYSLDELEAMIDPQTYFRANRAHILHRRAVIKITKEQHGKLKVQLSSAFVQQVIVSKEKAKEFKTWMDR